MQLASGVGLRQAGCFLQMKASAVQNEKLLMTRMLALLHDNLSPTLTTGSRFLLDEEEAYEAASIEDADHAGHDREGPCAGGALACRGGATAPPLRSARREANLQLPAVVRGRSR